MTDIERLQDAIDCLIYSDVGVDEIEDCGFSIVGDGFETNDGKFYRVNIIVKAAKHPGPDDDGENTHEEDRK